MVAAFKTGDGDGGGGGVGGRELEQGRRRRSVVNGSRPRRLTAHSQVGPTGVVTAVFLSVTSLCHVS